MSSQYKEKKHQDLYEMGRQFALQRRKIRSWEGMEFVSIFLDGFTDGEAERQQTIVAKKKVALVAAREAKEQRRKK
jgi:hypothetical protein